MKRITLYLWQLPQNIVGLIFLLCIRKKTLYRKHKHERVYISKNMRGGISLGNYIIIRETNPQDETTIEHERGHCKQSRMLGWLYLLVIGLPSVLHAAFHNCDNYYHFYTEKWADKLMNIERDERI